MAHTLYTLIPDRDEGVALQELARRGKMDVGVTRRVLHILWQYDLVKVW
jgi:hypothetical protein